MSTLKEIAVPDIGNFQNVDIIDVLVQPGEEVQPETPLLTLETDKATMDVPSPEGGTVHELKVKTGDKVSQGDIILVLDARAAPAAAPPPAAEEKREPAKSPVADPEPAKPMPQRPLPPVASPPAEQGAKPHASPSVRKFARELGADLSQVAGSGHKGRITKSDVKAFIKGEMTKPRAAASGGFALPEMPEIDFSQFGPVETQAMSRIQKISSAALHRNWLRIPHVTQFDEADITDLEAFRKSLKPEAEKRGVKMTPLAFLMKAAVAALKQYPTFNTSLGADKESLIVKKYFHLGFAVDTPGGLVVPVIRDVDQKSLFDIAGELGEFSLKARDGKLGPSDMQGGCFTISSLGGIGGTAFTPIINAPEVAILGVSRSQTRPVWDGSQFAPRLMLPLSLSYDHRVIDGAEAVRFTTYLSYVLGDVRRLLL